MDVKLTGPSGIPYLTQGSIKNYSSLKFYAENGDIVKVNPVMLAALNSSIVDTIADFEIDDCCVITEFSKNELEEINQFSWTGQCKNLNTFIALGIDLNAVFYQENLLDFKVEVKDEDNNETMDTFDDHYDDATSLSPLININTTKKKCGEKNWTEEHQKLFETYELPKPLKEFKVDLKAVTLKSKSKTSTNSSTEIDYNKKYGCHLCTSRFTSNQNLQSHLIKLHSEHYNCLFCKKAFALDQEEEFKRHMFRHENKVVTTSENDSNNKDFSNDKPCTDCVDSNKQNCKLHLENSKQKSTMVPKPLVQKKRKKSVPVKKVCEECGSHVTNLKIHMSTVHGVAKYACPQCSISFKTTDYLKTHIDWVHVKVPCSECGVMVGRRKMPRHIREKHTAMDDRKFKCGTCGKGFTSNAKLKDHTNIHTGEKPYKCKFCNACFASIGNHAMHQRSHLGHRRSK